MGSSWRNPALGLPEPAVAAVLLFALSAGHARTFDFAEGKWDRGEFFEARNDDWNRGDPIMQMPDCVMNANNPEWSDEELYKNRTVLNKKHEQSGDGAPHPAQAS